VGSYAPARAVFNQRKREKVLEDHAAGSSKAVGRRDPSVTEEQREEASRRLLLTPTTAAEYQLKSVLAGLFVFTFSLDARGGTARGVTWSDLAVRRFTAMFSELGGPIYVLCTYITASKTTEGIVHNIGALGHVNAWLCPVGAMADALVATFHSPGMDETRPLVTLSPVFDPTDAELRAGGVTPALYRAADQPYGYRPWYRVPLWPSARGSLFQQINPAYHHKKQREVLLQCGVSNNAAKTHLGRRAAAQKGKEAGVSENDIKKQGIWNPGLARGAYDAAIPNRDAIVALSSRPLSTTCPTTPRLQVPVPPDLQATLCPWLESEEKAYEERLAADELCVDEALVNVFRIILWARSAFFQSWAARFATGGIPDDAYIRRHPLLADPLFKDFEDLMQRTLSGVAQSAVSAVEQMIPQLAPVVEAVVEASAVTAMADLHRHERYMEGRLDAGFSGVHTQANKHAAALMTHTDAAVASMQSQNQAQYAALTAQVTRLQDLLCHVVHGRGGALPALPRQGAPHAVLPPPPAGDAQRTSHPPCPTPDPSCSSLYPPPYLVAAAANDAAAVSRSARVRAESVPVVGIPPLHPPTASPLLLADRAAVRDLRLLGKLEGVRVADDGVRCAPLMGYVESTGWSEALDEYALGTPARAPLRDIEQQFGNLWRLMEPDTVQRRRLNNKHSRLSPMYEAFERLFSERGRVVGVKGVLTILKGRWAGERSSGKVIREMGEVYLGRRKGA